MTGTGGPHRSMAWLHACSGLVVGWVLLAVFLTGTARYDRADISRWTRPALVESAADPVRAATMAGDVLRRAMPETAGWYIGLPKPVMPVVDGQRWKSLDGHDDVGVIALPFHRMIVCTGLVTLAPMPVRWGVGPHDGQDELRAFDEAGQMPQRRAPAGRPGTLLPFGDIVARATSADGEAPAAMRRRREAVPPKTIRA